MGGCLVRPVQLPRSAEVIVDDDTQTFVGDVVFTEQTSVGRPWKSRPTGSSTVGPFAACSPRRTRSYDRRRLPLRRSAVPLRALLSSSDNCHCQSCRRASGAAGCRLDHASSARSSQSLGHADHRSFTHRRASSRRFCGVCGTALIYETDKDPTTIDVTSASLDDPNRFPPTAEVWLEDKLAWAATDSALAQHPQGSLDQADRYSDPPRVDTHP